MVDADIYWPLTQRLIMGRPPSSLLSLDQSSLETPPINTDGSNEGALAMPKISPLVQSMQMHAPAFAL